MPKVTFAVNRLPEKEVCSNKAVLLPPSAFTSTRDEELNQELVESSRASSVSTMDREEMSIELKNMMTLSNVSMTSQISESVKSVDYDPKRLKLMSKSSDDLELIELKKRLENLSKKSAKLK